MFAYIGCRTTRERGARGEGIGVYQMAGADCAAWARVQLVGGLVNPSFLAPGRAGRVLYAVHGDQSEVSAFRIDPATGHLAFLNRRSTEGRNPVHLAVERTGRFLVVANYATGTLASLPIGADGALGAVADLLALPGETGPHREQRASHPHQILPAPDARFLIVPDKGVDRTFTVALDEESGRLRVAGQSAARPGAGPRHGAFQPGGDVLHVVGELDSTVMTLRYNQASGGLEPVAVASTLPEGYFGANSGAGIAATPSGRYVYVSNRGHDSVARFAVEPGSGTLRPLGWTAAGGATPRFIALDPTGAVLHVANETGDSVVSFRIDEATGMLAPLGRMTTGSPVCIHFGETTGEAT